MNIDDVLVGSTTVRVLADGAEFTFSRDGQDVAYTGAGEAPRPVVDALTERDFTVANDTWPKTVTVQVHDEATSKARDLFPDRGNAYHRAQGMGTFLDCTYLVEETGDTTLLSVAQSGDDPLVRRATDAPAAGFDDIWAAYTDDEFGSACELYLPDELSPADWEEVGYMEQSRRSPNERHSWSKFYDFYIWLVENGYAVVPRDTK